MKKLIVLFALTLIGFNSFSQVKDSVPQTKNKITKTEPLTQFPVTLTVEEWNTVIGALNEIPARVANPIMDKIKQTYTILTTAQNKKP